MQNDFDQATLDTIMNRAQPAAAKLATMSVSQIEKIVRAVARAAVDKADF